MIRILPNRLRVSSSLDRSSVNSGVSRLKRFGYCAVGIIVGLTLAGVGYYLTSLVGVAVSGAETVEELHEGWVPIRVLVALRVAMFSGSWVYGLCSGKW